MKQLIFLLFLIPSTSLSAQEMPWSVPALWELETRDIQFETDNIQFVGTLHFRKGAEDKPAIIIVNQGPNRHHRYYHHLTKTLPAMGISVFIFDQRGSGESSGQRQGVSYNRLAKDIVAAKKHIKNEPEVDANQIGFWGISQTGWLAVKAGTMSNPSFVISVASPLTTPAIQMADQAHNFVLIAGYGQEAADKAKHARLIRDEFYRGDISYSKAYSVIAEIEDEPWFEHAYLPSSGQLPEDPSDSTWLLEMDYDPLVDVNNLDSPLLIILGGEDPDIPVAQSVAIYQELPERRDRQLHVIPGANHLMRVTEEAELPAVRVGEVNSNVYLMLLATWLSDQVKESDPE